MDAMGRAARAVAFALGVAAMATGDAASAVACIMVALWARPRGDAGW